MKLIKTLSALVLTSLLLAMMILPSMAAVGDNIALNCTIDSTCDMVGDDEAAYMLVDDDPSYATKWCSIDHVDPHIGQGAPDIDGDESHQNNPDDPYHWIVLDFGSEKSFDSVRLVKASEGERDFGGVAMDAAAFYFEVSNDKATWTKVLDVTGNGEVPIYEGKFAEVATARYLKLTVVAPEADEANPYLAARLYDLKVFEAEAPVVEEVAAPVEAPAAEEAAAPAAETPAAPVTAPQTADFVTISAIGTLLSAGMALVLKRSKK